MCSRAAAVLCVASFPAFAAGVARGSGKVSLRTIQLTTPEAVVSQSDVDNESYRPIYVSNGAVSSGNRLSFSSRGEKTFSIAGTQATIAFDGKQFSLGSGRARPVNLTKRGKTLIPQIVRLPDKRRYVLAFPTVSLRTISYRSGAMQAGRIGGKLFALYDDNTDGQYTTGDTFTVGSPYVFAPLAQYASVGSSVYRIESVSPDGSELSYSRYEGETSKVKLKRAPALNDAHVAFGSAGAKLNFTADRNTRSVEVIPGTYGLLYGLAYSGKLKKAVAGILPGDLEPVEVSGREAAIRLGAPYKLEFNATVNDRKLAMSPSSFKLKGVGGEQYVSFKYTQAPTIYLNGMVTGRMGFS